MTIILTKARASFRKAADVWSFQSEIQRKWIISVYAVAYVKLFGGLISSCTNCCRCKYNCLIVVVVLVLVLNLSDSCNVDLI